MVNKFEVGKWYLIDNSYNKYVNYGKYLKGSIELFEVSEYINIKGSHNRPPKYKDKEASWSGNNVIKEVEISKIAQYLPSNHPDLLLISENLLSNLVIW